LDLRRTSEKLIYIIILLLSGCGYGIWRARENGRIKCGSLFSNESMFKFIARDSPCPVYSNGDHQ